MSINSTPKMGFTIISPLKKRFIVSDVTGVEVDKARESNIDMNVLFNGRVVLITKSFEDAELIGMGHCLKNNVFSCTFYVASLRSGNDIAQKGLFVKIVKVGQIHLEDEVKTWSSTWKDATLPNDIGKEEIVVDAGKTEEILPRFE